MALRLATYYHAEDVPPLPGSNVFYSVEMLQALQNSIIPLVHQLQEHLAYMNVLYKVQQNQIQTILLRVLQANIYQFRQKIQAVT